MACLFILLTVFFKEQMFLINEVQLNHFFPLWIMLLVLYLFRLLRFSVKMSSWASLVAQQLRIRLPRQGARVRALAREDPTCRRATKPMCHNY